MIVIDFTSIDEIRRVERQAQKVLRAMSNGIKPATVKAPKVAKSYACRVKQYKARTGKKRLRRDEKAALHLFTPSQVQKRVETTSTKYAARVKRFRSMYGEPTQLELYMLQYAAPKATARKSGRPVDEEKKEKRKGETPIEWETFTPVVLPGATWISLPSAFTDGWSHRSGSFMYANARILWLDNSAQPINMQQLFDKGEDGYDHSKHDFFSDFTADIWNGRYTYDPAGDGSHFIVLTSEWNECEELDPDYLKTGRYKRRE